MIAHLIISLVFVTLVTGDQFSQWQEFKLRFNKTYNGTENTRRFEAFKMNLALIEKHNQEAKLGYYSFRLGLNQLSDLDHSEYVKTMLTEIHSKPRLMLKSSRTKLNMSVPIPTSFDWRNKSCVSPVKDQGQCGSATIFSAVGALEGQEGRRRQPLVPLSVQQLADCCGTGSPFMSPVDLYNCVQRWGGLDSEACYPYRGQCDFSQPGRSCRINPQCIAVRNNGYGQIAKGDEQVLRDIVAIIGPVSVGIDASRPSFQMYLNGIYNDNLCTESIDHFVLIVGYGSENGKDYWIVKNSWGSSWGENGYIRMSRNKKNQCGIASLATYPTLADN